MAYDEARRRVVLFGGVDDTGTLLGDTWEWDGSTWHELQPATSPTPRAAHAMAFDPVRGVVLLFGGDGGAWSLLGDTWAWDGTNWQRLAATGAPSARREAGMATDAARARVVLHGGRTGTTPVYSGETYEWDGTAWALRGSAGPASIGAALAYDAARQRVAHVHAGPSGEQELWDWDGTQWTRVAVTPGLGAQFTSIASLPGTDLLVRFGGLTRSFVCVDETWLWDGTSWTVVPFQDHPLPRHEHAMAFDAARGSVLLFGGTHPDFSLSGEAGWLWDGTAWAPVQSPRIPAPRARHEMTFDRARAQVVMFGGVSEGPFLVYFDETWVCDAGGWSLHTPAVRPPGRADPALAFDERRGVVVLFGGEDANLNELDDTWEWDGTTWTQRTMAPRPSRRGRMAYDAARDCIVFLGGASGRETWEYDGAAWTRRTPANTPNVASRLAYDPERRRVACLAPLPASSQTAVWEWDGSDWSVRAPAPAPAARDGYVVAHDERRARLVAFGGAFYANNPLDDTWECFSVAPARVTRVGSGCAGSTGRAPDLRARQGHGPWIGDTMVLDVTELPPAATAAVAVLDVALLPTPMDLGAFGAPGCLLHARGAITLPAPAAGGTATLTLPIRADPALVGVGFAVQALVPDAGANALGWIASNAAEAVCGQR